MSPVIGEKSKPILVGVLGVFLAIFLGFSIGSGDYNPLVFGVLGIVGLVVWFGLGEWFWPVTIASFYLGGTFPVLGGSFTPFQILMVIGVAKFLVEDVILRRKSLAKVDRALLITLAGFILIITVHGIRDRFGMRFLGSSVWGGRNYVNVYVGLIAFFVIQSVSVRSRVWNKLPYLVLAVSSFDLLIATVTTVFPATIYKIYPFYSAVGVAGITELTTGHEDVTGRIGAFGNFGFLLIVTILAATPLRRLFSLSNLFRLGGFVLGSVSTLVSGYRSAVMNVAIAFTAAAIRDFKAGALLVLPVVLAVFFGLSWVNSEVVRLPKQVQRGLAFVPGDWDPDMTLNAEASDDFRWSVWTLWYREYFPNQPLLGRGFGFRSEFASTDIAPENTDDYQQMVEVGNIHNGFLAALDAVGIIGTLFFVAWTMQLLWRALRVPFDRDDPTGFALRFAALQLVVSILSYWIGAVTMGTFLPGGFALAGVFLKLHRESPSNQIDEPLEPEPVLVEPRHMVIRA